MTISELINREAYTSMSKLVANYGLRHDSLGLLVKVWFVLQK